MISPSHLNMGSCLTSLHPTPPAAKTDSAAVVLKVGSLDQHHLQHLRICEKCIFSGPTQTYWISNCGKYPAECVWNSFTEVYLTKNKRLVFKPYKFISFDVYTCETITKIKTMDMSLTPKSSLLYSFSPPPAPTQSQATSDPFSVPVF